MRIYEVVLVCTSCTFYIRDEYPGWYGHRHRRRHRHPRHEAHAGTARATAAGTAGAMYGGAAAGRIVRAITVHTAAAYICVFWIV